jgi:sugar phosphate isomerase/epimerase
MISGAATKIERPPRPKKKGFYSMEIRRSPRPSVSSWALRRALGATYPGAPGDPSRASVPAQGPGSVRLLDVPARLAALGFHTLEICHFHLPTRDAAYLGELRAALKQADIELWSLLIDDGDITHPEHRARDLAWIGGWIDTAASLGATCARVIAGKAAPSDTALERSRAGLTELAARAREQHVRLMTENWFALLPGPGQVHRLLDSLHGAVGLCLDFGNWGGPAKYDDLAAIAPRAQSCHAKASFAGPGAIDEGDFRRCLDLTREAGFAGPYTLVNGGPGDEWEGLTRQREILSPYLVEFDTDRALFAAG